MKKSKWLRVAVLFLLVFLCSFGSAAKTEAASFNLLTTVSAKTPAYAAGGTWKKTSKGLRYTYANGKHPKNVWRKISGKYYYFDKNGYVRTGWVKYRGGTYYLSMKPGRTGQLRLGFQRIGGKYYYFSKSNGKLQYGWKVINGSRYYFDKTTGVMATRAWVDGRYLLSNGKMAKNRWIGNQYVGSQGYVTKVKEGSSGTAQNTKKSENTKARLIIVGDSRTVGMESCGAGEAIYIGKVSMGYSWLKSTAGPRVESYLAQYPESVVVFQFGVNDLYQVNQYIAYYKSFIARYPKADIYIMSVNPVNEAVGIYSVKNSSISSFNAAMKAAFPKNYLDCYSYLQTVGFSTSDGLHYNVSTYQKIYNYIVGAVNW